MGYCLFHLLILDVVFAAVADLLLYRIHRSIQTLWLSHSQFAMENPPIFKNGKPSISMGHGYVSHNQRVHSKNASILTRTYLEQVMI